MAVSDALRLKILAAVLFSSWGGGTALGVLLDPGGRPPRRKPVSSWLTDVFE